jgi:hypothetical protein
MVRERGQGVGGGGGEGRRDRQENTGEYTLPFLFLSPRLSLSREQVGGGFKALVQVLLEQSTRLINMEADTVSEECVDTELTKQVQSQIKTKETLRASMEYITETAGTLAATRQELEQTQQELEHTQGQLALLNIVLESTGL